MRFVITKKFEKAYRSLSEQLRKKADKALHLLIENPAHPSIHLKKIQSAPGIWEARIDKGCRMTLEIHQDYFLLRTIGKHDEVLDHP